VAPVGTDNRQNVPSVVGIAGVVNSQKTSIQWTRGKISVVSECSPIASSTGECTHTSGINKYDGQYDGVLFS